MTDPKIGIKDIIKDNWVASNTSSVTPAFSTGWYNAESKMPQVTITDSEDTTLSKGETRYFGIATNGAPAQYWVGTVSINCWSTREANAVNPKKLIYEMKEEVKRIIKANYGDVSGLDYIAWHGSFERVDDTVKPVVFRQVGECGYGFLD